MYGVLSMDACIAPNCALRAPTLFSERMKSASARKTRLWIKATIAWVCFYTRSPIAGGCAFHPHAIGDPRGRAAVRAIAEMNDDKASRPDWFGFARQGY
jgi:hypothetical protein